MPAIGLRPADPSHFTIDYDLNGVRGVLDGRLFDATKSVTGRPIAGGINLRARPPATHRW